MADPVTTPTDESGYYNLDDAPSYGGDSHTSPTQTQGNASTYYDLDKAPNYSSPLSTSYKTLPTKESKGEALLNWVTSGWDNGQGSIGTQLLHGAALGTRNAVEGIASPITAAIDLGTYPGRALYRLAGGTANAPSTAIDTALDAAGAPTPQTPAEQRNANIVRGGAAMLTPMGLGTAAPSLAARVPAMVRPLVATDPVTSAPLAASQVAAGATGAGAGEALANNPNIPDAFKPTARVLGNLLGAGGVSGLTGAAGTLLNMAQGVKTPIAEALERLGITPRTVGAVSQSPTLQEAEAVFSKVPMSSGPLQRSQQQMVGQFGDAVEDTAHLLDPSSGRIGTAQDAGATVQDALRDWKANTFGPQQDAAWNPLNQRLSGTAVDPSGYRAALGYAASPPALASLPANQQAFASTQANKWLDALNRDAPPGQSLSWEQAQAIKRQIGDAMGTPDIVSSIPGQQLKGIYGGLANDMRTTATAHGQVGPYDAANAVTIDGHNFMDSVLSKAVSANNPAQETIRPDDAANALLRDNTAMQQLRARVPDAADALGAWKLRQMAQAKPSGQGDTSTGSFLTGLRTQARNDPQGTAALFADPAVRQRVNDLAAAADQFRSVEKNANTSNTGVANMLLSLGGKLALGGGGYAAGGLGGLAAGLAGEAAYPWAVGKALTSPLAIKLASTPAGPRPPIDSRVAGLLGYAANQ